MKSFYLEAKDIFQADLCVIQMAFKNDLDKRVMNFFLRSNSIKVFINVIAGSQKFNSVSFFEILLD
jgi:hypothetical protein